MQRLGTDLRRPDPVVMSAAAALLRAGGLVAFPAQTVYGLGVDPLRPEAVRRRYPVKG